MIDRPLVKRTSPAATRRGVLAGLAGSAIGGIAGLALGYKFRHELHDVWRAAAAGGSLDAPGVAAFKAEVARIYARRGLQTAESVAALKARSAKPVLGKVKVWELIEKLSLCIDAADAQLFAVSQLVHVTQILAAMEREGVQDPNLHLIALLHDLGKVALLAGASPEDVLGGARRIGDPEAGIGLDNVVFQFGHAEFIYSRIKDHVPDVVAWVVRHHNIAIDDAVPFMTSRERDYTERYLRPFRRFDAGFKSYFCAPAVDMARYRDLIDAHFPNPSRSDPGDGGTRRATTIGPITLDVPWTARSRP
jgi:hypothetical protein